MRDSMDGGTNLYDLNELEKGSNNFQRTFYLLPPTHLSHIFESLGELSPSPLHRRVGRFTMPGSTTTERATTVTIAGSATTERATGAY